MKLVAKNDNGDSCLSNIWVSCKLYLQVEIVSSTSKQITVEVKVENKTCIITKVYVGIEHVRKRKLWRNLLDIFDPDLV